MIFALDIGNTNIVLGIIDTKTEEIIFTSRISSDHTKTVDEYAVLIQDVLAIRHIALSSITGSIISSVVPNLSQTILSAVAPVSYTHLDVYKRQKQSSAFNERSNIS